MLPVLENSYTASFQFIDNRAIARPSFYFDMMQDAATLHASALHIGRDELPILWVLTRCAYSLSRPIRLYEHILCKTWCAGVHGAVWYRNFSFHVGEETVGTARSMWTVLEREHHHIVRPKMLPDVSDSFFGEMTPPLPKLTAEGLSLHHTHPVVYSDLDSNCHLNNVRIVDMVCDTLELHRAPGFVAELQVNYTAETEADTVLSLFTGMDGDTHLVTGCADGVTRFEASARYAPNLR